MAIGWVYSPMFLSHDTGRTHPECPERLHAIVEAIQSDAIHGELKSIPFSSATIDQLTLVHDPAYVDIVRMMCDEHFMFVGSEDTTICPRSYDVASMAVGGVLAACDAVMKQTVMRAFCAVRPPGHHATTDQAMGFCLFNNVALAAKYLIHEYGLSRVAIVDFDAHHGNGTQQTFYASSNVLYASIHERPGSLPFPGSGEACEIGCDTGVGFTVNVPLDRGAGEDEFVRAIRRQVVPRLDRFQPQFVLISAGFDALIRDNVSNLRLKPPSFGVITDELVRVADGHANGRLVSVLEGGYDLAGLGPAVLAHLHSLVPR